MEQTNQNAPLFPNDSPPTATHCDDCDEESFCNCENNERVTPYYTDPCAPDAPTEANAACGKRTLKITCGNARKKVIKAVNRLCRDWKEGAGNPYIKKTSTTRVEIYRSPTDKTPIDRFQLERTKNVSACALAAVGACLIVTVHVVAAIVRVLNNE